MLRVLSGVRVQQSGGKARSLTVTKTLKTEESAGPAVTLRSVVELELVRQADLAVLMAKNKAGGRDPYDPAVVAEAKRDEQLPFDIWSFDGASTWQKSKYMDLVWFSRDEVTGKLIGHLSGLA